VARALAEMTLAPHAKDPGTVPTPESVVAEFDQWLDERPPELDKPWREVELEDLLFGRR
jgi:hypothetical protein